MQTNGNNWSTEKIILVSAAVGLIALLLLLLWLGFSFWSSFLWGLIVAVIVYLILTLNFAGAADGDDGTGGGSDHGSGGTSGSAGTGSSANAGSGDAAAGGVSVGNGAPAGSPASASAGDTPVAEVAAIPDAAPAAADPGEDYDKDGVHEGTDEGSKPEMLSEARAGGADNLKEIKGVGPAMEKLLNSLGVFHFDQIAGWSADETAWVDANLKGFKGRVSRDNWVDQAKILAAGGETEFSQRVDDGKVY